MFHEAADYFVRVAWSGEMGCYYYSAVGQVRLFSQTVIKDHSQ